MKLHCRVWIILLLILSLGLSGCSATAKPKETGTSEQTAAPGTAVSEGETGTVSEGETGTGSEGETGTAAEAETAAGQETAPQGAETAAGSENVQTAAPEKSPVKEALLKTLWKKIIQRINSQAPYADKLAQWSGKTYMVEALLGNFTEETHKYGVNLLYPPESHDSFVLYWSDTIENVPEHYLEAEQRLQYRHEAEYSYNAENPQLEKLYEESVLRISGQFTNEAYDRASFFTDNLGECYYYLLWGSVMEVAGDLWQEANGSILGEFSGRIYMENFDFDTLTGTFRICLDGMSAVRAVMVFANEDCGKYTVQTSDAPDFSEEEKNNAWLGVVFDLTTERTAD